MSGVTSAQVRASRAQSGGKGGERLWEEQSERRGQKVKGSEAGVCRVVAQEPCEGGCGGSGVRRTW